MRIKTGATAAALAMLLGAVTACSTGPGPEPTTPPDPPWPVGAYQQVEVAAYSSAGHVLEARIDACGYSPVATARESADAVVIAAQVARSPGSDGCAWQKQWATVVLDQPVGGRAVIDHLTGRTPRERPGRRPFDLPLTQVETPAITGWVRGSNSTVVVQVEPVCGLLRATADAAGRIAVESVSSYALVCLGNGGVVAAQLPPGAQTAAITDRQTGLPVPELPGVPEPSPYADASGPG